MLGVFSEFEREMIIARVKAGLGRARQEGKRLGRLRLSGKVRDAAILALRQGVRTAAQASGASLGALLRKQLRWALTRQLDRNTSATG